MKAIVHLEPQEFIEAVYTNQANITARPYVLDNGVAGMVYMFHGKDQNVYYLDRMFGFKQDIINQMSKEDLHAEMYRKVALDMRLTH